MLTAHTSFGSIKSFFFLQHDDREVPRRQKNDRSRARSRSPVWVHDKFDECEAMDEEV